MPRTKGKPKPPVPNRDTLIADILKVTNEKHRALFAFMYLTGCRISEIVGLKNTKWNGKPPIINKYHLDARPIQRSQLTQETSTNGKPILLVSNVSVLKQKPRGVKHIPISIESEPSLSKCVIGYANTIPQGEYLWDYHKDYVGQIIKKELNPEFFSHFMRHCRASRLVGDKSLNISKLIQMMGWKDARPATTYTHLNWKEYADDI